MSRLLRTSIATRAATAAVVHPTAAAGTEPTGVRLLERTVVCTTGDQGGTRVVYVRAQAAYGQGASLDRLAGAYVSTTGNPDHSHRNYRPSLAGVDAGSPPPPPLRSDGPGLENNRRVAARQKVGLSRRRLAGGAASETGDDYTCVVARRVLVRVRAVFRSPVEPRLTSRGRFYGVQGRILHGELAIASPTRTPLVYGDLREDGRARLFATGACG